MNTTKADLPVYGSLDIESFWEQATAILGSVTLLVFGGAVCYATDDFINTGTATIGCACLFAIAFWRTEDDDKPPIKVGSLIMRAILLLAVSCGILYSMPKVIGVKVEAGTFYEINGFPHLLEEDSIHPLPFIDMVVRRKLGGSHTVHADISEARRAVIRSSFNFERSELGIELAKRHDLESLTAIVGSITNEAIRGLTQNHASSQYLPLEIHCRHGCNLPEADELLRQYVKGVPDGLRYSVTIDSVKPR